MARIVKEYTIRRNEILDVAQRLVYTVGYEGMTVQDILDELQISKGAFYHYFDSKQALLDALVERMVDEALQVLLPIVQDPTLPALDKIHRFFDTAASWKTARKEFILALVRVWYQDGNAIVRQKQISAAIKRVTPLLAQVIHQGIREGTLATPYPDQVGEIVMTLVESFGDTLAGMIIAPDLVHNTLQTIQSLTAAYTNALERVLGASPGSLQLVDLAMLKEWFVLPEGNT
jgi:AcrR family transcriptional regulator